MKRTAAAVAALALAAQVVACSAAPQRVPAGATLVVDGRSGECDDSPADPTGPYCTINAATARVEPGQTVEVRAGTYREQVELRATGTGRDPIVVVAAPGATVTVTGREHGFRLTSKSYVTVQGFTIAGTHSHGIVVNASDNVTIGDNTVLGAGERDRARTAYGIAVLSSRAISVSGNHVERSSNGGIHLDATTSDSVVDGNTVRANGQGGIEAGPGIDVRGHGNRIVGNRAFANEDSGIQFHEGASGNLVVANVAARNRDHGIDVVDSPHHRIAFNTVLENVTAGINVEGNSVGTLISSNISTGNAPDPRTRAAGNIRVTAPAAVGTVADHNLVHGGSTLYVWASRGFGSLEDLRAASGQERHGRQGPPALGESYVPLASSPAIDLGDPDVARAVLAVERPDSPDAGAFEAAPQPH